MGARSVSNVVARGTTLPQHPFLILQRQTMSDKQSNVCAPPNCKNIPWDLHKLTTSYAYLLIHIFQEIDFNSTDVST